MSTEKERKGFAYDIAAEKCKAEAQVRAGRRKRSPNRNCKDLTDELVNREKARFLDCGGYLECIDSNDRSREYNPACCEDNNGYKFNRMGTL